MDYLKYREIMHALHANIAPFYMRGLGMLYIWSLYGVLRIVPLLYTERERGERRGGRNGRARVRREGMMRWEKRIICISISNM